MSGKEKNKLNQLGQSILRENGFKDYQDYLLTTRGARFANHYLEKCWNDSKMFNEADVCIYRQLVDIDSKLGTNASRQLRSCLSNTTRWDLIKVLFTLINTDLNLSRLLTLKKWRDTKN